MSRKYIYGFEDLDELYDKLSQEPIRRRDRKRRFSISKEHRYKFSRRNHLQRNDFLAYQ